MHAKQSETAAQHCPFSGSSDVKPDTIVLDNELKIFTDAAQRDVQTRRAGMFDGVVKRLLRDSIKNGLDLRVRSSNLIELQQGGAAGSIGHSLSQGTQRLCQPQVIQQRWSQE